MTTTDPRTMESDHGSVGRMLDVKLGTATRPSWRGRLHLLTLAVALPGFALLVAAADDARARVGAVVYSIGLGAMFAVSTTYHRWVHTVRARAIWRRADHATIFVGIAATATPLWLAVDVDEISRSLVIVWIVALGGVLAKALGGPRAHRLGDAMYLANGWAGVFVFPPLWAAGRVGATALLAGGGLIYTLGALAFARQWPTLRPAVFGYHEVWHLATMAGAGAHFVAVWLVIA